MKQENEFHVKNPLNVGFRISKKDGCDILDFNILSNDFIDYMYDTVNLARECCKQTSNNDFEKKIEESLKKIEDSIAKTTESLLRIFLKDNENKELFIKTYENLSNEDVKKLNEKVDVYMDTVPKEVLDRIQCGVIIFTSHIIRPFIFQMLFENNSEEYINHNEYIYMYYYKKGGLLNE